MPGIGGKVLGWVSTPTRTFPPLGHRLLAHNRALEAILIGNAATGILASIVMARSIGPAGRGTVVTLTVWGQVLGWLATLSLDKALVVLTAGTRPVVSPDEGLQAARRIIIGTSCLAIAGSLLLGSHFFS